MRLRLFQRRTILFPTWAGLFCVTAILCLFVAGWLRYGEWYLAETRRAPADTLIVEGWIGRQGIRAAVDEFRRGGYRYLVAAGGLTSGRWEDQPTSYAEMAAQEMVRLGLPKERILVATAEMTEAHRTFESAAAVWQTLRRAGITPRAINVFTLGPHARRSAMVFGKVNSGGPEVGVIGWMPPEYKTEPWWRSSERSRELLEETVGYLYEVLLNSGRLSNTPACISPNAA
ncbi:MAG: YdcF family protein [Verrucomicrobia bacterium]|nr:YdcF family protein [Verrucomicrobiota bacterium]